MNQKAQIFILDIFFVLFFCLLLLYLEAFVIEDYLISKKNNEEITKIYTNLSITESLLLDPNYLFKTYKNQICLDNLENIKKDYKEICSLSLDNKTLIYTKPPTRSFRRGVIYKNKYSILEVGFCD